MAIQDLSVRRTPYNSRPDDDLPKGLAAQANFSVASYELSAMTPPTVKAPNRKSLAMKENWRKRRAKEAEAK